MRNIIFVTVASKEVGMGHLIRSLSLADMLRDQFNVAFVVATDTEDVLKMIRLRSYPVNKLVDSAKITDVENILPFLTDADIVVLDFYGITEKFQLALKHALYKFVCIDDLHENHFYANAVINVSNTIKEHDYSCEPYTKLLLGTDYVLLRSAFLQSAMNPPRVIGDVSSVFINMGGADLPNNTLKFLKGICSVSKINEIHIILGIVNPHRESISNFISNNSHTGKIVVHVNINGAEICNLLNLCQLAICPASGISMELCSVGIGIISGYTANNQKDLLAGLVEKNCVISLNDFNLLSESEVGAFTENFVINNKGNLNEMIFNQKMVIDGKSPVRLRKIFQEL